MPPRPRLQLQSLAEQNESAQEEPLEPEPLDVVENLEPLVENLEPLEPKPLEEPHPGPGPCESPCPCCYYTISSLDEHGEFTPGWRKFGGSCHGGTRQHPMLSHMPLVAASPLGATTLRFLGAPAATTLKPMAGRRAVGGMLARGPLRFRHGPGNGMALGLLTSLWTWPLTGPLQPRMPGTCPPLEARQATGTTATSNRPLAAHQATGRTMTSTMATTGKLQWP